MAEASPLVNPIQPSSQAAPDGPPEQTYDEQNFDQIHASTLRVRLRRHLNPEVEAGWQQGGGPVTIRGSDGLRRP